MPELAINIATKYNASGATAAKRDLNALQQASQGVKGAFANLQQSLAGGIQSVGAFGNALLPLSAGLAAIGVSGLKSMAEFSQTMENTRVIVNATEADMAALTQQALDLGAASVFSANEVAAAQRELGKAGLSTNEIMGALPGVLNLAAAGQVDMATAASLTTSALNSFGLEVEESARVADLLAGAANASLADITDLGQGMQQAGFAFAEANWPIEDLATSLAILTDRGLTGSDAGTALKNAWTRMVAPTKEAKGVMDELGISFFTATGNMKSLPEIIDNLNMATAGLTEEQRANLLSTIFLSDGYKALAPLLDEGVAGFNEYKEVVTEAGAAQKVAEANMKGLAGAIEYIMGSIDSAMKAAFLPWEEVIADTIVSIADLVSSVGDLPDPILKAAVAFAAVLAVAGPLAAALPYVAAAFGALLSPIGLVVLAIAGLAAAWAADLGNIQEITASIVGRVRELLSGLWTGITTGNWQPLLDSLATLRADLSAWFTGMKASISAWVKDWWNQFTGTDIDVSGFQTGLDSLGIKLQIWFAIQKTKIKNWVEEWWNQFTGTDIDASGFMTGVESLGIKLQIWFAIQKTRIKMWVDEWWTQFSGSDFWTYLVGSFDSLQASIGSWIGAQTDVIYAKVSGWWDQFSGSDFGSGLISAVETLVADVVAKFDEAKAAIAEIFSGGDGEGSISIGNWSVDFNLDALKQAVASQISGLTWDDSGFSLDLQALATGVQEAIKRNLNAITWTPEAGFEVDLSAIRSPTLTAISAAIAALDWAGAAVGFQPDMRTLMNMVVDSMQSHWDALIAGVELPFDAQSLVDAIRGKLEEIDFADIGTTAGAGFAEMVNAIVGALEEIHWGIITAGLFIGMVEAVKGAIAAIEWSFDEGIFAGLKAAVRSSIQLIDWSAIGTQGGELFAGLIAGINYAIKNIWQEGIFEADTWTGLGTAIVDSLKGISWGEAGPLGGISADLWIGLEQAIIASFKAIGWDASDGISEELFASLKTGVRAALEALGWENLPGAFENFGSAVVGALSSLHWDLGGAFDSLVARVREAIESAFANLNPFSGGGGGGLGNTGGGVNDGRFPTQGIIGAAGLPSGTIEMALEGDLNLNWKLVPEEIEIDPVKVELEPTGFKGGKGGLASLIPPDQRVLEVEIEPQAKGGGLISSLKDLIPSLDTIGAEFEIPEPKWLSSLVDWNAEEPSWLSSLLDWIPDEPPWQNALLSWVPDEPPWQSSLLNWIAKTPPWHSPLLNWVAKTPPWVPQLTSWVAPTPGWVPALLSYTLPRPTWWGTEAGYIQKPSWWGSSAGTITNVTRVETVSSGGSGNVRSAARSAGIR